MGTPLHWRRWWSMRRCPPGCASSCRISLNCTSIQEANSSCALLLLLQEGSEGLMIWGRPGQGWAYRIVKLSNANLSDFSDYRRNYCFEPTISRIFDTEKFWFILSFFAENSPNIPKILQKFRKFPENTPKTPKIRRKFLKKKVFFEAKIWYSIEKKNTYCIEWKKTYRSRVVLEWF